MRQAHESASPMKSGKDGLNTRGRSRAWRRALVGAGVVGLVPPAALIGAQQSGAVDLGLNPVVLGAALWITTVVAVTGFIIIIFERRSNA